ncbi:VOC family protein [Sphingopyxis sp.]|uniref:VOC family protein n=1 Tax=Sphingopyxis sp. TaxID=1908224 RepID=UPI002619DD5D|nr:VOC family protein [Sphingopyxis sp.]MCW0200041.1 VOC family protein [Sphingopyxis sp.]
MADAIFGAIDQLGFVVADLDRSLSGRMRALGLGPWTVFRGVALDGRFRGQPTHVTIDVALAYQGDMQIELIQPVGDAPSPYRDESGAPLCGMHHMAWIVDDLDAAVASAAARGLSVVFTASNPSTRVAYLEVEGDTGVLYEFIEGAGMREMVAAGIAATRGWDGSDPVTVIDLGEQ